jgi:SAM-dependent methyltransferase
LRPTHPDDARRRVVEDGYDRIVERYLEWAGRIARDPRGRFVAELDRRLPEGARVLDLGCGAGLPTARDLSRRFEVVGVDISERQIAAARENVPDATFVHADATHLTFAEGTFDGVAALYAISHMPRDEHAALFERLHGWLRPGGLLVATLGADDSPDWTGEWLGVPMFFSSYDTDTNRELLRSAGFELLIDEVLETLEPEGAVEFLWVLARRRRL